MLDPTRGIFLFAGAMASLVFLFCLYELGLHLNDAHLMVAVVNAFVFHFAVSRAETIPFLLFTLFVLAMATVMLFSVRHPFARLQSSAFLLMGEISLVSRMISAFMASSWPAVYSGQWLPGLPRPVSWMRAPQSGVKTGDLLLVSNVANKPAMAPRVCLGSPWSHVAMLLRPGGEDSETLLVLDASPDGTHFNLQSLPAWMRRTRRAGASMVALRRLLVDRSLLPVSALWSWLATETGEAVVDRLGRRVRGGKSACSAKLPQGLLARKAVSSAMNAWGLTHDDAVACLRSGAMVALALHKLGVMKKAVSILPQHFASGATRRLRRQVRGNMLHGAVLEFAEMRCALDQAPAGRRRDCDDDGELPHTMP